jgi:hypothetical protein
VAGQRWLTASGRFLGSVIRRAEPARKRINAVREIKVHGERGGPKQPCRVLLLVDANVLSSAGEKRVSRLGPFRRAAFWAQ